MTRNLETTVMDRNMKLIKYNKVQRVKALVLFLVIMNIFAFISFAVSHLLEYQIVSSHVMDDPIIDMDLYCSDPVNVTAPASRVMIVMFDSRSPCQRPIEYHQLSAKINAHYARRHGYGFLYFSTPCPESTNNITDVESKTCTPCSHPLHGPRASPWCKLPAINYTMHAYKTVEYIVYVDSDSVFHSQSIPVDWVYDPFLNQFDKPVLTLFNNHPWTKYTSRGNEMGCSGIMFWRNNERARILLQEWWDFDVMFLWNKHHPYEQQALHELIEIRKYDMDPSLIQVLDISAFPSTEDTKSPQFMLHMNPPQWKRVLGLDFGNLLGYRSRLWRMWRLWLHILTSQDMIQMHNTFKCN